MKKLIESFKLPQGVVAVADIQRDVFYNRFYNHTVCLMSPEDYNLMDFPVTIKDMSDRVIALLDLEHDSALVFLDHNEQTHITEPEEVQLFFTDSTTLDHVVVCDAITGERLDV